MPTYEYVCRACDHSFDTVQAMADAPLTTCPECGGDLRKVFHPAGIAFKGSGFYATDNRKGTKSTAAAGTGSDSGGSGGSEGGSESGTSAGGSSDTTSGEGSGSKGAEAKPKAKEKTAAAKDSGAKGSTDKGSS